MLCCPKTSTSSSPPDSASSSHRVTRLQTSNFSHLHHHTATNHHAPPVRRPAPRLDFANAISSRARTLLRAPLLSRGVHHSLPVPAIPEPTVAIPDVSAFLAQIGRKCDKHTAKFSEWEQLFSTTSAQLKELGVEPARARRYIIRWREKYRVMGGAVQLAEQKRGRKIDGGERRCKEVRAKRFAEERRKEEGRER